MEEGLHAFEILFRELWGDCHQLREDKCWPCSPPCQCLAPELLPARAAQGCLWGGGPGRQPGATLQSGKPGGPPEAALTYSIFFSRNASPVKHPLQFRFIICIFSLCQLFSDCALWTNNHDTKFWDIGQTFWIFLTVLSGSYCRRDGCRYLSLSMFHPVEEEPRVPW